MLNLGPSLGSGIGMIVPAIILDNKESLAKITMKGIEKFSIGIGLILLLLSIGLKYRPKEGVLGPGVSFIMSNKPFVSLVRL